MVIELREFNDKKKKKKKNTMDKINFAFLAKKWSFNEIWYTDYFDMFCDVKSLKVKLT